MRITIPPEPPKGTLWRLNADGSWTIERDDAPEIIRSVNMSGGTGE